MTHHDALLEKRESEVITSKTEDAVAGEIAYKLSLSVKPDHTANAATVTKQAERTADCSIRFGGLLFDAATYVFEPSNWNVARAVPINVRRDVSAFQGTPTARFDHIVTSDDPADWASPFLRPMSMISASRPS
jgi:hypothetical protein